jgi:uncharacterized delta-60 repeat protein
VRRLHSHLLTRSLNHKLRDIELLEDRAMLSAVQFDGTFGESGVVEFSDQIVSSLAVQSNGQIVVAVSDDSFSDTGLEGLVRLNEDGSIDPTFGNRGIASPPKPYSVFDAVQVIAEDKLLVQGRWSSSNWTEDFLVQYNADGTLDANFGDNGYVKMILPYHRGAVQLADGSWITHADIPPYSSNSFQHYFADGQRDPNFGQDGTLYSRLHFECRFAAAGADFVVTGKKEGISSLYIARYDRQGVLLSESAPLAEMDFRLRAFRALPDGKFLVHLERALSVSPGVIDEQFIRFNADLSLDTSFDSDGVLEIPIFLPNDKRQGYFGEIFVQADGKYLLQGAESTVSSSLNPDYLYFIERLNIDGSRDSSFGTDGRFWLAPDVPPTFVVQDLDIYGDLLLAATKFVDNTWSSKVIRILNDLDVNHAPRFSEGPNQVDTSDGAQQIRLSWATDLNSGSPNENHQNLSFEVSTDHPELFRAQPTIDSQGTLRYTAHENASGLATATIRLRDNGGTARGGRDISLPATFFISIGSASPWQNPINRFDVTGDGQVIPHDILHLIDRINRNGAAHSELGELPNGSDAPDIYYDVSGDNVLTPNDLLQVIDYLNRRSVANRQSSLSSDIAVGFAVKDSALDEATDAVFGSSSSIPRRGTRK